jgi:hypothetical protein
MWYGDGRARLNGANSPRTSAIFPGDVVRTEEGSEASIVAGGSVVSVRANSSVHFQADAVALQVGTIAISTSNGMAARIGDITVRPKSEEKTEFEIHHPDTSVVITAQKGDLVISDASGSTTLSAGQQTRLKHVQKGSVPAAKGAPISGKTALKDGAVGVAIVCLVFCLLISPTCPDGNGVTGHCK